MCKMLFYFISCLLFLGFVGGQISDAAKCASDELNVCIELIPRTQVGLPRTSDQLNAHCQAYQTGMKCMDAWMTRCLPTDEQKLIHKQIQGAKALMRFLCANDSALRKEFLKDPTCLTRVSPEWSRCVNEMHVAGQDIAERAQLLTYVNKNAELCCARSEFLTCVAHAGQLCSGSTANLLRRIAFVLASDIGSCPAQPLAYCAAPSPLTGSIATLITLLLYPRRIINAV